MSKSELYIGNELLDFNNPVNVKRQVNDYRDPSIGGNAKTFTLEIPLTKTNRKLLGFIDDVRSREEVSEIARLTLNGMEAIRGKFRILSSNVLNVRAIIEGNDWVGDISGTSIKDLSWAGGDEHDFTSANILASWTAGAGAFYRYPLINFSELISGDYGGSYSDIYSYEFYPMWQIEDIVTKLFLDAGYTLAGSGFFAGTFGQSLYILSDPKPSPDDHIVGKAMEVYVDDITDNQDSQSIGTGVTDGVAVDQVMDIDAETIDEGSDFNTTTNRYTAPEDGTYRFQSEIDIWSTMNRSPGNWTVTVNTLTYQIRKNGVAIETVSASGITSFDIGNEVYTIDTGYIHLEAGDYIDVHVDMTCVGTNDSPGTLTAYIYLKTGATVSFLNAVWDEQCLWPGIGKTISPSDYLPDLDGVEFLKGMKEAFNLRFFVDRNNKTVYIETSDDFYGSTVVDWREKIDYSKGIGIDVISSNYKEKQKFKWNPDTNDKAYTNKVSSDGVPFMKELTLTGEYLNAGITERTNPTFSPTVHGDMPQIAHWGQYKIPRIFGAGEFVSASRPYPASRAKSWRPRIFEWKGMVALTAGSFSYFDDIQDSSGTNYTTFPSAETPDMSDMYDAYLLKDWNRIEKNKIITIPLKLSPAEIMKFMTVVGTPSEEGFRAKYLLNVEGVDMYFICSNIVTDGDLVQGEFVQKM
jgi:hypothetical protein